MVAQNSLVLWAASSSDPVSRYSDTQWGFFWLLYLLMNMSQSWGGKEHALNSLVQSHKQMIISFAFIAFRRCLWTKLNQKPEHFCFWNTTVLNTPNPKIHLQMQEWHEERVTHLLLGHEFPAGLLELHPMLPRLTSSGDCSLAHCRQSQAQEFQTIHPCSFCLKWAGQQWNQEVKSGFQDGFTHWLYNVQEGTTQPKICFYCTSILPCLLSDRRSPGRHRYLADTAGVWVTTLCQTLHLAGVLVVNNVQVMLQRRIFCALKVHQFFGFIHIDLPGTKQTAHPSISSSTTSPPCPSCPNSIMLSWSPAISKG